MAAEFYENDQTQIFCLKICQVSLTSHLYMRAQPYAYKDV